MFQESWLVVFRASIKLNFEDPGCIFRLPFKIICFNDVKICIFSYDSALCFIYKKNARNCLQKEETNTQMPREINTRTRVESRKRKVCGRHMEELGEGSLVFLPRGADATSSRLLESEPTEHDGIDAPASFLPLACRGGGDFVISRREDEEESNLDETYQRNWFLGSLHIIAKKVSCTIVRDLSQLDCRFVYTSWCIINESMRLLGVHIFYL